MGERVACIWKKWVENKKAGREDGLKGNREDASVDDKGHKSDAAKKVDALLILQGGLDVLVLLSEMVQESL